MKTNGVDLHKDSLTLVVLDDQGVVIQRDKLPTKRRNKIREWFASCGPHCQVAVESVGFYQWFWDLVQPQVTKLVLADPTALKPLRPPKQAKTDRKDAELLARERRCLRWLSLKMNRPGPKHLTSDAAQKWLLAQDDKLSAAQRLISRQRLDQIGALERQLADVQRTIDEAVAADPWLAHRLWLRISRKAGQKYAPTSRSPATCCDAWRVCRLNPPFHWPDQPVP